MFIKNLFEKIIIDKLKMLCSALVHLKNALNIKYQTQYRRII